MKALALFSLALFSFGAMASNLEVHCPAETNGGTSVEIVYNKDLKSAKISADSSVRETAVERQFYRYGVVYRGEEFVLHISGPRTEKGFESDLVLKKGTVEKSAKVFCHFTQPSEV